MLIRLSQVLDASALARVRAMLQDAPWADGRVTAGPQSARAKHNEQLPQVHPLTQALQAEVVAGLNASSDFFSATLPKRILPPLFNRYGGETNHFSNHVDNAIRYVPGNGERVRTDVSGTLFLSDPQDYDGGELVIEDTFGEQRVKLAAGDLVLYPGTSVHRVEPVTRGQRVASFFWAESMVRSDEQRRLLYGMDRSLVHLRSTVGEDDPGVVGLTGSYHNLLRLWADT